MGVAVTRLDESTNLLHESMVEWWIPIDSEVLLLTFLPGLIFKDAISLNFYLFQVAFVQCLNFAILLVLAGTILTGLVAFYIFPYGWSFNLALTFGSILSATDPVAVSALLESLGAPPRLKIHISGESLLNDGSAMVFYTIFSSLYLSELGEGLGEDISVGEGFALFFRMSLGGVAVGIFFGLGALFLLKMLDRRLDHEENVVQVACTVALAYLCYWVGDVAWEVSGLIATLFMGLTLNAFGRSYVNDSNLFSGFWSLVEYLLNSVLFALGGLVWGSVIANSDDENPERRFTAKDWGVSRLRPSYI